MDNQYLLNTPFAYILQNKSINEIENSFDENGWNIMHYAVADANVSKITELIHFSFNCNINSKKNCIPESVYILNEKKKIDRIKTLNKIPFCNDGFTPLHLTMFFYNYYRKLAGEFFYQQILNKYQEIISIFLKNDSSSKSCRDANELTLFDYAFLLEDIELIEIMHMNDPDFSSLNKVSPETAKRILEVMKIKHKDSNCENVLEFLNKKIFRDNLEKKLPNHNINGKKTSVKKV